MFSTLISAAALSLLAAHVVLADFTVNSPTFTQCGSTHITWSGTSETVNILLVSASNPCEDTVADLGDHTSDSMTWTVALPAGTQFQISAEDANGDEAWSKILTVEPSSDSSCLSAAQLSVPTTSDEPSTDDPSVQNVAGGSTAGALGASGQGLNPTVSGASARALTPLLLVGTAAFAAAAFAL